MHLELRKWCDGTDGWQRSGTGLTGDEDVTMGLEATQAVTPSPVQGTHWLTAGAASCPGVFCDGTVKSHENIVGSKLSNSVDTSRPMAPTPKVGWPRY